MSKIKIVTDSTAYLTKEFIQQYNIDVVPLSVTFEGAVSDEGFPGEFDSFFDRLSKSKDFPTTSQPSIGKFVDVFKQALNDGYEVIAIVISSKLSGTFNSASVAAGMINTNNISVIDSLTSVSNLKALIEKALFLSEKGLSRAEIVQQIEEQKKRGGIRLTVATLDYLKKGGRLSSTEAFLGSLLNIKPIIGLIDGKLEPVDKVRGKKKAIEKMIEEIPSNAKSIYISHVGAYNEAVEYETIIKQRYPDAITGIYELGPVIGCHLGAEAIGICYMY
ncbi:DegV family protein [Alkaliphilus oremlandii]|uniref:DegV family protein n=1 Tax=Alkaliphilus oremlandii (strain OhILAs) TaxID=350688 RepID=A8MIM2_ALKOO|nr:DegV family protein [Alkaliphilus oremlandii]ABW19654.1 degV family protein [Alkaliphilus oremlandii OhILAs]